MFNDKFRLIFLLWVNFVENHGPGKQIPHKDFYKSDL